MRTIKIHPELQIMFSGICKALEMDEAEVKSRCREKDLVNARYLFFKHAKDTYKRKYSLSDIGAVVGRDHASVLYGVKAANMDIKTNYNEMETKYNKTLGLVKLGSGRSAAREARQDIKRYRELIEKSERFIQNVKDNTVIPFTKAIDSEILVEAVKYFDNLAGFCGEFSFKCRGIEIILQKTKSTLEYLEVWNGDKDYFNLAPEQLTYFTTKLNLTNGL